MPPQSITAFKEAIQREGGLSTGLLFLCQITGGSGTNLSDQQVLLCKSLNMPAMQVDTVPLKYFTRTVTLPGSRQYAPLTATFIATNDYKIRAYFMNWLNLINGTINNTRSGDVPYGTLTVTVYFGGVTPNDAADRPAGAADYIELGQYTFSNVYPSNISPLQYSYDNDGQVQTYDVEFQYLDMNFAASLFNRTGTRGEAQTLRQRTQRSRPPSWDLKRRGLNKADEVIDVSDVGLGGLGFYDPNPVYPEGTPPGLQTGNPGRFRNGFNRDLFQSRADTTTARDDEFIEIDALPPPRSPFDVPLATLTGFQARNPDFVARARTSTEVRTILESPFDILTNGARSDGQLTMRALRALNSRET